MQTINSFLKKNPEILRLGLFSLGAVGVILFTNHLMSVFAPFLIAYIITMLTRPTIEKMIKRVKIPRVISTLICMLVVLIFCSGIVWFFIYQIANAITYLVNIISNNVTYESIQEWVTQVLEELDGWGERLNLGINAGTVINEVYDSVKAVIKILSTFSFNLIVAIPETLVSIIMGCIAAFYMMYDYEKISNFLMKQCSSNTKKFVRIFNQNVLFSVFKMLFSYVIISVICFFELSLGFMILGIKDAWFVAFIIAVVDVLPILGSGGILTPWAIIAFISGDFVRGFGLLALWGVIIVVRQIVEPKIVGSQVGLHPLIIIMSMYIGLETMGAIGLVMAPLYVIICKKLNEHGIIRLYKG